MSPSMNDGPPVFTQMDISADTIASLHSGPHSGSTVAVEHAPETIRLLRDVVALQHRSCELLGELVAQVSLQQRRTQGLERCQSSTRNIVQASCRIARQGAYRIFGQCRP